MTTVAQALDQARQAGMARIDAQLLLLHALGKDPHNRAWLIAHDDDGIAPALLATFQQFCARRLQQEPVAYITGRKEFYGLPLQVSAQVLDPRPDTEILVDWALECVAALKAPRILDLGTGSGAIALALQSQRPDACVVAVDLSAAALQVAQANAQALKLPVTFLQGSWFAPVIESGQAPFDLIVSNPPYLAEDDPHLPSLLHEPLSALVSQGEAGLHDLECIAVAAKAHLKQGAWLLLEHGWQQHPPMRDFMQAQGWSHVQGRQDLAGHTRCTGGQWQPAV